MNNIEIIIGQLAAIGKETNSGRLRVGSRIDGKLHFATLYFRDGHLFGCEYCDLTRMPAVNELFSSSIVSSVFIQGEIPADMGESALTDTGDLISRLRARELEEAEPAFDANELVSITVDALTDIFGKRAASLVADIAARTPPEKSPQQFLEQCAKRAADFAGGRKATEIFKPLYELI